MSNLPVLAEPSDIEQMADPANYVALACERANAWLADALDHGDIETIVEIKSQAEAIRIYTTQKKLGKDAELAAAEVVRRAERGIGVAIRRGQEKGEIRTSGGDHRPESGTTTLVSPTSLVSRNELYGSGTGPGVLDLADASPDDEQFEEAIAEAKAEGNLSRANVVRKVKGEKPALDRGEFHRGRRHIDHYRVFGETVATLEGLMMGLRLVDLSSIPEEERAGWSEQLREALRPLNRFAREVSP